MQQVRAGFWWSSRTGFKNRSWVRHGSRLCREGPPRMRALSPSGRPFSPPREPQEFHQGASESGAVAIPLAPAGRHWLRRGCRCRGGRTLLHTIKLGLRGGPGQYVTKTEQTRTPRHFEAFGLLSWRPALNRPDRRARAARCHHLLHGSIPVHTANNHNVPEAPAKPDALAPGLD